MFNRQAYQLNLWINSGTSTIWTPPRCGVPPPSLVSLYAHPCGTLSAQAGRRVIPRSSRYSIATRPAGGRYHSLRVGQSTRLRASPIGSFEWHGTSCACGRCLRSAASHLVTGQPVGVAIAPSGRTTPTRPAGGRYHSLRVGQSTRLRASPIGSFEWHGTS